MVYCKFLGINVKIISTSPLNYLQHFMLKSMYHASYKSLNINSFVLNCRGQSLIKQNERKITKP